MNQLDPVTSIVHQPVSSLLVEEVLVEEVPVTTGTISIIDTSLSIENRPTPLVPPMRKRRGPRLPATSHVSAQSRWYSYPDITIRDAGVPALRMDHRTKLLIVTSISWAAATTALAIIAVTN